MSVDSGLHTCTRFLVQRQVKHPSCMELQFEQVTQINLVPTPEQYCSVILDASLTVHQDGITWVLNPEDDLQASEDTWVTAKI